MTQPTTKSYAYIAAGQVDGVHLMKVGKTNNLKRRGGEIGILIELSTASLTEAGALRLETELRQFVIAQGGIRYRNTIDWFAFDVRIYALLCEHFTAQPVPEFSESLSPDEEIALYRRRYIQLLKQELRTALEATEERAKQLQEEIDRLRQRIDSVRNEEREKAREREQGLFDEIVKLNIQEARLELRMEILQKKDNG